MCGLLQLRVIQAIFTISSFWMIFRTMCGPSRYGGNPTFFPLSPHFIHMSSHSLVAPSMPSKPITGRNSITLRFAISSPHMGRFFVSLAPIPRNKTGGPNGSYALSTIAFAPYSSMLMCHPVSGPTPSPPHHFLSTFVHVVFAATLHRTTCFSGAHHLTTIFASLGASATLASPPPPLIS